MTKFLPFYYDEKGFYQNDKSFMITGKNVAFLTAFLNSSLFKYCFSNNFPRLGDKGRELRKIFFDNIRVIKVNNATNTKFRMLIDQMQNCQDMATAKKIDSLIFDLYCLNDAERSAIGFIEIL